MEDRRKGYRRLADRQMIQRLNTLDSMVQEQESPRHEERSRERRRQIRHTCAVSIAMFVRYSSGYSDTWETESVKIPGRILDLSTKGAALFSERQLAINDGLALTIKLADGTIIIARASVKWVKHIADKHGYAMGVEFVEVSDKDRRKIGKFLEELDRTLGL